MVIILFGIEWQQGLNILNDHGNRYGPTIHELKRGKSLADARLIGLWLVIASQSLVSDLVEYSV